MPRRSRNYILAVGCWSVVLVVLLSGKFTIRLDLVERLDRQILAWFAANRTDALDQFFTCISWSGSSLFLLPVILLLAVILTVINHHQEALLLTLSFVGAGLLAHLVKLFIARPRPSLFPAVIDIPTGFSFPSSHSAQITAFVIAGMLLMKVSSGSQWTIPLYIIGGSLIALVCISRLYMQVHYPSDVLAGFISALFWVTGLATLLFPDRYAQKSAEHGWRIKKGK